MWSALPPSAVLTAADLNEARFGGFSPVTVIHLAVASGHSALLLGHFHNFCWQTHKLPLNGNSFCTAALSAAFGDRVLEAISANQEKSEK